MKKIITLFMLMCIFSSQMISCLSLDGDSNMSLKPTKEIEKNKDLLELVEYGKSYKAYDYTLKEDVKWVYFKGYILNTEGKWEIASLGGFSVNELDGNLVAMNIGDNNTLKVSYRDKNGVRTWIGNEGEGENFKSSLMAINFIENKTAIELEKEIPIAVEVVTDGGNIENFTVDDFYNNEKLREYSYVTAATVTFSNEEIVEK